MDGREMTVDGLMEPLKLRERGGEGRSTRTHDSIAKLADL